MQTENKFYKQEYISDIITLNDVYCWKPDSIVLINSSTGSGKSYFIMNTLAPYAKSQNKQILFLTNRTILRNQVINSIPQELRSTILVTTYQSLTNLIIQDALNFDKFDFIVSDECHFFFSDSCFNCKTDISLEKILSLKKAIKIFLSATSLTFENFIKSISKELNYREPMIYRIRQKLNYENLYHYKNNDSIIRYIRSIPNNEKIIMFCNSIEEAYENHKLFPKESAFICSQHSKSKYKVFSSKETQQEIEQHSKFSSRILFTTKVLDNGINIIDRTLKHIIIDISDFDTLIQCIGRKRFIDESDKVNVYIQRIYKQGLNGLLNNFYTPLKKLKDFKELPLSKFVQIYGRTNFDGLIYEVPSSLVSNNITHKINKALEYKLLADRDNYIEMKSMKSPIPNIDIIAKRYEISPFEFKNLEKTIDVMDFQTSITKYLNVKLFTDNKKEFIDYIQSTSIYLVNKKRMLGIQTINGYFSDIHIPYHLECKIEKSRQSENRDKRYWILLPNENKE